MAYFYVLVAGCSGTRKTHSDLGHHARTDRFQCLRPIPVSHEEPDCDDPPLISAQGKNVSCMFLLSVASVV